MSRKADITKRGVAASALQAPQLEGDAQAEPVARGTRGGLEAALAVLRASQSFEPTSSHDPTVFITKEIDAS